METSFRFGKSVENVVAAGAEGQDQPTPTVIYRKRRGKKKGSPGLRLLGKAVRGAFDAQQNFGETYEAAHDRSNEKKKDGWLLDLAGNLNKAGRKAMKKLLKKL